MPWSLPEISESEAENVGEAAASPSLAKKGVGPRVSETAAESERLTFYDELAALKQAQSALGAGRPEMALGLMLSLEEKQPGGALGVERKVTTVLALCALGRRDEARAMGRKLLSASGSASYAARLRGSCAQSETEETKGPRTEAVSDEH